MRDVIIVGKFNLPNGSAAAQLIKGFSKIIKSIGYNITIIDVLVEGNQNKVSICETCVDDLRVVKLIYPNSISGFINERSSYKYIKKYITDDSIIIPYNFSSMITIKIMMDKRIRCCIPLVTEWHSAKETFFDSRSVIKTILKTIDVQIRMRIINRKSKNIITCSSFLGNYYKKANKVIIPTIVDYDSKKWHQQKLPFDHTKLNFVYAGTPGINKEKMIDVLKVLNMAAGGRKYVLRILGITKKQMLDMYPDSFELINNHSNIFMGKRPHEECIRIISSSDFSILYREKNRVTSAGFPTKFGESMACGTPAIVTDTSDLKSYVIRGVNGVVIDFNLKKASKTISTLFSLSRDEINTQKQATRELELFNYKRYVSKVKLFLINAQSKF